MRKNRGRKKFAAALIMTLIFVCCFAVTAFAADTATFDVAIIVHQQSGNQPFKDVQVQLGKNTKYTNKDGIAEFRMKNIPAVTDIQLHLADPNKPAGSHAEIHFKKDTATTEVVHNLGNNTYDIWIEFNGETEKIIIHFGVTPNDEWEVGQIEFIQGSSKSNQPPQPAPGANNPGDPPPNDPDMPAPGQEPNLFGPNGSLLLYIIIGALAAVIIVLVVLLAAKKSKASQKDEEDFG